jgi:signal transduction histidine kinase
VIARYADVKSSDKTSWAGQVGCAPRAKLKEGKSGYLAQINPPHRRDDDTMAAQVSLGRAFTLRMQDQTTQSDAAKAGPGDIPSDAASAAANAKSSLLQRIGLQGKLIFAFMAMLTLALGLSCWLFVSQSTRRLSDIMGEQARQISYALALSSKSSIQEGDRRELQQIGDDLLKSRNILFVAFLDKNGDPICLANRDPDFTWGHLPFLKDRTTMLMRVYEGNSPVLGRYVSVTAPVLSVPVPMLQGPSLPLTPGHPEAGTRLLGYVSVGISEANEETLVRRINYYVVGIGFAIFVVCFPFSYMLVHRIFQPIRELVAATKRIAGGDLRTSVAIHRSDVIGELARDFNNMVQTVRKQRDALNDANQNLAEANVKLAEANEQLEHANHLLEKANSDLERKVVERTSQLEAANRRLQSEIAEKEDFVRVVSHDLNAPLRNIDGMATMLLMKHRDKLDEDVIHRLERIQKNVQVETDLITELLELSRIKTRRQKMESLDLRLLVQDLCGMFENDLKSKGIELIVDTPLPVLNCEKARMRQVFQNLIDNAIKYMGEGPVKKIHIGCEVRADEAEFYVRDTGIGIDAEDLSKVFVVFRRGKNTVAQNVAGKGVGLASVKSIIETYSGTIWVQSKPAQGSTFRFTIAAKYVAGRRPDSSGGPRKEQRSAEAA